MSAKGHREDKETRRRAEAGHRGRYNRPPVPRHRTARTAVLGVNVRRPVTGKPPSRSTSAFRRRVVIGSLVVLALVLITVSFRKPDDGPVASGAERCRGRPAAVHDRGRARRAAVPRRLRLG